MAFTIVNIKNASLTLSGKEFADHITSATLNSSYETFEWKPISGNDQFALGEPTYELVLEFGQDYSAGSLFDFLFKNHGTSVALVLEPESTGPSISANVVCAAPQQIAGGVGIATSSATLKVNGSVTIA